MVSFSFHEFVYPGEVLSLPKLPTTASFFLFNESAYLDEFLSKMKFSIKARFSSNKWPTAASFSLSRDELHRKFLSFAKWLVSLFFEMAYLGRVIIFNEIAFL